MADNRDFSRWHATLYGPRALEFHCTRPLDRVRCICVLSNVVGEHSSSRHQSVWVLIACSIFKEVVTGRIPFSQYKHDGAVMAAVCLRDERPQRLIEDITPEPLLTLWCRCWHSDAAKRPMMMEVCQAMFELSAAF